MNINSFKDIKQAVRQAALPLQALELPIFPAPPRELSDDQQRYADLAVEGIVVVHYQGEHHVRLGRTDIVWLKDGNCTQIDHFVLGCAFISHLAQAWTVTGKIDYARAARDFMGEFMTAWPADAIGTGERTDTVDSTLTLGGRNAGWCRSLPLLLDSPCFDDAFVSRLVEYLAAQFQFLRQHVKSEINWRIFNARDLLTGSLYLSFLEAAADWKEYAVMVLNDGWLRQFLPDGVHCERNPIYHCGMVRTFQGFYELGCKMPELGLIMNLEQLIRQHDFIIACVKPNGYLCGIHDSQSEYTGHRRDNIHTTSHKGVDSTATWQAFLKKYDLPLKYPPASQVFPDAGLAFFRTGWDEEAMWMSFDATRWGGGHCHLSRNAVQLHAFRQSMVIDPGWLAYDGGEWGMYGKSTLAHSTCNLNRMNQSSTNPSIMKTFQAPGYDAVLSIYEGGYWDTDLKWNFTHAARGIWAQHGRILFRVGGRFAFVADSMYRLPHDPEDPEVERPDYECVWQLAPGADIDLQSQQNQATARWRDAGLLLSTPIRPGDSEYRIHCGETDPLRGWSPGEGEHYPAPQIVLNTPRMSNRHDYYVTLLVPFQGGDAPNVRIDSKSPMGQTGYVVLNWEDGSRDAIHWGCNLNLMLGKTQEFATDSSLVHLRYDAAGSISGGGCVNGTYMKPFTNEVREQPATFVF